MTPEHVSSVVPICQQRQDLTRANQPTKNQHHPLPLPGQWGLIGQNDCWGLYCCVDDDDVDWSDGVTDQKLKGVKGLFKISGEKGFLDEYKK